MRRISRLAPALFVTPLVIVVAALAGCGDNSDDGSAPPTSSAPSVVVSTQTPTDLGTPTGGITTTEGSTALPSACEVIGAADVAAAFAVPFGPGQPGGGGVAEGDLAWQSDNCDWEAEDLLEVQLALVGPDDFTEGDFTCPEPTAIASTVEPVPGLGDAAYWDRDDSPPLEATLRVCRADSFFDIDLEYEDGVDFEGDPQQQAIALAGLVLVALG
ncbi:hypothetical protein [Nocardioides stalactiti]|uniref:hypothetical protein n=1 Tax=Nocardioides stalactiti TaxID=2755356 RepID=UPI001600DFC9|nr:hypothetical protein [Nocardioides stalactiti]